MQTATYQQGVPVEDRREAEGSKERKVFIDTREKAPREFHIRYKDGENHGWTKGCGGCSSFFRGLSRQPHTEACRDRFRQLMKDDAKVKFHE